MPNTIEWEKPNGTKIVTNDGKATVAYAKSLKWKKVKADQPVRVAQQTLIKTDD